jgi:hypothetical protein
MNIDLLDSHVERLRQLFPGFGLLREVNGTYSISGNLGFTVKYDGKVIRDDYDVEILIPDTYPNKPPTVKEIGGRIIRCPDNHIYDDGSFCLGAPLVVKQIFSQQRNLLWFVKEQVVRFLFNHSFKRNYGIRPDGELSHGAKGLLEFYYDFFNTNNIRVILDFLRLLSMERYDDHAECPCGSGLKIRRCHHHIMKKARKLQSPDEFLAELLEIIAYIRS